MLRARVPDTRAARRGELSPARRAPGPERIPPALLSGYGNRAIARALAPSGRTLQRRADWEAENQFELRRLDAASEDLLNRFANAPSVLARLLLARADAWIGQSTIDTYDDRQIVARVLDRAKPAVFVSLAEQLDDARIARLKTTAIGVLLTVARRLNEGGRPTQAERIIAATISTAHAHLVGESASASATVQGALAPHHASLQSIARGSGMIVYDEYSIVVDAMPTGLSPEDYLREMATDLNRAVNSSDFDWVNEFERTAGDRKRGVPAVGDVYDIDILGPDNGSVMLVESTPTHFIFQTVTVPQTGEHPESGSREFGFERVPGGIRWYTRGVSRPSGDVTRLVGSYFQEEGWTAMVTGIGAALVARGGTLRKDSFSHWIVHG